jgi:gamma-glutamyltranspeptidase/glutathione hydrolase
LADRRWAIATGHPLATAAAEEMLAAGGNAIDAGVAAGLTLGVVIPDLVSVAGVAPILLREGASGRIVSYDGVGHWPAATDVGVFERDHGGVVPEGLLRTVVPAAPAAWIRALSDHGRLSFGEVAAPAIRAAREGFETYPLLANFIADNAAKYARFPSTAAIFLPGGVPPRLGSRFVQSDLAATLDLMVRAEARAKGDRQAGLRAARDMFYRGDIAATIADFHAKNGGWLTMADLADYEVRQEKTLPVSYRGLSVHCCGAWCQGISMAQALSMIERLGRAPTAHETVEILKRVFADRDAYVTDPRHMEIAPEALLAPDYIAERLASIDPARSDPLPAPGVPAGADADALSGTLSGSLSGAAATPEPTPEGAPEWQRGSADTSHVSVIDGEGNMFSATPSDTSSDTVVIPGTGLSLSSRGSQSRGQAKHLNAAAPGKRPRLTPNPVLALRDGAPFLAFGTPGGDVQVQAMVQVLSRLTDHGESLQSAVEAPRFASYAFPGSFAPHEVHPNLLMVEEDMPETVTGELREKGHDLRDWPARTWKAGGICAALQDGARLEAVADPRRAGTASLGGDQ